MLKPTAACGEPQVRCTLHGWVTGRGADGWLPAASMSENGPAMDAWSATTFQQVNAVMREHRQGEIHDYQDEQWWRGWVRAEALRFLHHEFRGVPVDKGRLFVNVERGWHQPILDGELPLPSGILKDIRGGFSASLELVVVRDTKRDLYVLDGCKRVLTACFHGQLRRFPAFVVDTDEHRDVVEE